MNELPENQTFDFYDGIISLEENEMVKQNMPICSLLHHRFVYLTSNVKELTPNKLKIYPFLHERRVYLERNSPACEYQNTTT